jgi:transcriptional regulator with AAA-type ATPase domain/tetratricopeptide (TPR) repeat protein
LAEIVGDSAGIRRLREQLEQILTRAASVRRPPPILLRGETGTGKGLVARTVHRAGPRAHAPFVDVNCAAIPETLLEAELFGYERGAFTDASQAKPGLFQLAHRGTLFLDEIGTLSPALQAKLLKVLEDGVIRRLGGTRAEPVDVWIVSATNEDLAEALRGRRFREDLYHRLVVLSLELPPLRERGADIVLLAERFLSRACADYGLPPKTLARDARAALTAYAWPGNVRELANVVERVALLGDDAVVTAAMLALSITTTLDDRPGLEPDRAMSSRDQMRAHLLEVLTETGWNISQTAVRLGVARNTVLARMARFGLNASTAASPVRSRPGGGPRRNAPATSPTEVSVPLVATSRAVWEPRRVALLRVDLVVKATGTVDGSRALDEMIGKVQIFGGEIVELGPSALVAAFGLEAVEDAPVRAALAALAIVKASERVRGDGAGPRVKIVVHVAQVLVSQLQGTASIDLEGKREAWKAIEALVGLDQLDTIAVSEVSAPFLERRFEFTSASPVTANAVPFRRLTRREPTGFGLGGRPLSRFVGRDAELRLVTDRLASAARGQGQVIGIVGEPGVGKSRFMYELTRLDASQGWRVLGGRGVSHGSTTPLLPLGDLLRRYFAIQDADGPPLIREKVTDMVLARHEALEPCLAPLLSLLDIPADDVAWERLDPRQRRQQIQDAIKRLWLDESRIQPLLLVIEDLHWVDAETRALLDSLVDSLPRAHIALLATYRPEYRQTWSGKTYYTQIRIDPLPEERARMFLGALLGEHETLDPLKRLLIERTDGNPLFLEESVRTLVESQALEGEPGAYRMARPVEVVEVPATVEAILAGRIDRLRSDERRLLQLAAVIGRDVPFALLQAIADQDDDMLREALARLQATEFLYETRIVPDPEFTFKHALTQEVAYASLLEARRRELHAAVAGAIETLYADRLAEHVERLADHTLRGGLLERAVSYLRQAGLKASARSALADARGWFEQALAVIASLPESSSTLEQAFDIRLDLRLVLALFGEIRQALEHLHDAERLAERLNDDHRRGRVCVFMTNAHSVIGELDEGLASGTRALEIARRLGDLRLRIPATTYLEQTHYFRGEHERVVALALENLSALPPDQVSDHFGVAAPPAVYDRGWLIMSLSELGRFAEAAEPEAEAIRLALPTQHAFTVGWAHVFAGWVHVLKHDWVQARPLYEHAAAVLRAGNVTLLVPFAVAYSAWVLAELGEASEAGDRLREGERLVEGLAAAGGYVGVLGWLYLPLGRAALVLGRLDDAQRLGERAVDCSRRQPGFAAHARYLLGDVATHHDRFDPERGGAHYRHALALAEPRGMRPLVAHCHLGLGALYRRTGPRDQMQEHLTSAIAMFREMGMRFWLEQAEAEIEVLA